MRADVIRVIADDREHAGGVIGELQKREGVEVEVRRLATGDFVVEKRFVVERKTLADFSRSLLDGRLFKQVTALVRAGQRAILILEGSSAEFGTLATTRDSLQGALLTVGVFFGISVLWSRDPAETARLIVYLARQAQRVARGGLSRSGYRPKGRRARQLFVLQGLPGVGPERAARLLDRFGSVQRVATASAEELAGVKGIGPSTAKRMRWILAGEDTEPSQ